MRRRILAAAAAVALALGLTTLAGAATQAARASTPISACTTSSGAIVAVDFAHWGGPVVRGCDVGHPASGAALMDDVGFTHTGTQHDGPAFICRIGNTAFSGGTQYPTPSTDPCVHTPPASAYWSYWLAGPGATSWSYSQLGAYSHQPVAGEVELWIFGGTNIAGTEGRPTCSPASLRAGGTPTRCTPASSGGSGGGSGGGASHGGSGAAGTGHSSGGAAPTAPAGSTVGAPASRPRSTAPAGRSTAAGSRSATPSAASIPAGPSGGSSTPVVVDARPAARHSSLGSATGLLVTVLLAALLAGTGGFMVWRRRRVSE